MLRHDQQLFREAEAALARRDTEAADNALARLIADAPTSPLLDQALLERARIAHRRHAWSAARAELDALARVRGTPLAESGRWLACRVAVDAGDADAARCLAEFRAAYPGSAHDVDALGLAAQVAHASGGCASARAAVDELARRYGDTALARAWTARCPEAR